MNDWLFIAYSETCRDILIILFSDGQVHHDKYQIQSFNTLFYFKIVKKQVVLKNHDFFVFAQNFLELCLFYRFRYADHGCITRFWRKSKYERLKKLYFKNVNLAAFGFIILFLCAIKSAHYNGVLERLILLKVETNQNQQLSQIQIRSKSFIYCNRKLNFFS